MTDTEKLVKAMDRLRAFSSHAPHGLFTACGYAYHGCASADEARVVLADDLAAVLIRLDALERLQPGEGLREALQKLVAAHDGFMTCNEGIIGNQADAYYRLGTKFRMWNQARQALSALSPVPCGVSIEEDLRCKSLGSTSNRPVGEGESSKGDA